MLRLIPPSLHRVLYRVADKLRKLWWRMTKPSLRAVAIIATDLNDQLLLIRLSYGTGAWTMPTGGIDKGEEPAAAARRELFEETGCKPHSLSFVGLQHDMLHGTDNAMHIFSAKVSGNPKADMREVIEARFFPMHSLPEPLTKTTLRRLELYRATSE